MSRPGTRALIFSRRPHQQLRAALFHSRISPLGLGPSFPFQLSSDDAQAHPARPTNMSIVAQTRRHVMAWATRASVRPMAIIPGSHQEPLKKAANRMDFWGEDQGIDSRYAPLPVSLLRVESRISPRARRPTRRRDAARATAIAATSGPRASFASYP